MLGFSTALLIICILPFTLYASNGQSHMKTVTILPFETIAADDISYIQSGILQMFYSRMSWKNKVHVVPKQQTETFLKSIKAENQNEKIQILAELSKADYVIVGTITQFSEAFSIDTKIFDIKNKRYLTFSEQSKILSELIPKVDFIAAKMNKKVFDRNTTSYEQLVQTEKERFEQLKRQNPEKLMPKIPKGEGRSSGWKFWEYL